MYNAMLDRLPEDYQGWLIRTDYRIGVQIQLCISDPDISEQERTATVLSLLYGNGIPDLKTALDGVSWFISCGNPESQRKSENNEPDIYSFEYDSARIVSAFKKTFGIDISRKRLHWFEFVPMLADLQNTAFANVMDIRSTSVDDISQKKRSEFLRMKKRFALPDQFTEEENATINSVLEQINS